MASIKDSTGAQVAPPFRARGSRRRRFRAASLMLRNREWLQTMRLLGKSYRGMAEFLNLPFATVQDGIDSALTLEAAEREDELTAERIAERLEEPEVIPGTRLDMADLIYLMETYPPGTEAWNDPYWQTFMTSNRVPELTARELECRSRARAGGV